LRTTTLNSPPKQEHITAWRGLGSLSFLCHLITIKERLQRLQVHQDIENSEMEPPYGATAMNSGE
jgi:hypothetical protein